MLIFVVQSASFALSGSLGSSFVGADDALDELRHTGEARLDHVADAVDALVVRRDVEQVVEDRLLPREAADRRHDRGEGRGRLPRRRRLAAVVDEAIARIGLEVEQPPFDLDVRAALLIASIAQPNGLLSSTPPSTKCVFSGRAPASM